MKVELKNIKLMPSLSDETECFSATIYINGKKAGTVKNRGQGGEHEYAFENAEVEEKFHTFCSEQPCNYNFEYSDQYIDKLLRKGYNCSQIYLKTYLRKYTVFQLKGEDHVRIHNALFTPKIKKMLQDKHGDKLDTIFNELVYS